MLMGIEADRHEDVLLVKLAGRINHSEASTFESELLCLVDDPDSDCPNIVLDMQDVEYMSSVGLRVLMLSAKTAKKLERTIVVSGLQETMQEIFEISRFDLVFQTYPTARDAIAELSQVALASFES